MRYGLESWLATRRRISALARYSITSLQVQGEVVVEDAGRADPLHMKITFLFGPTELMHTP